MPNPLWQPNRQRRNDRTFQPTLNADGLESRVLLSTGLSPLTLRGSARAAVIFPRAGRQPIQGSHATAVFHSQRIPPAAEINYQYQKFLADFAAVEQLYVESLVSGSTSTISVSATLTAPYLASSAQMQVDNASVFGPNGTFATPVSATASLSGVPLGATYVLTGRSGNTLIVDAASSSASPLSQGTTLSALVQSTSQTSAAVIFPSYILTRTQELATSLVNYFNSLPLRLPYYNAPPHTANQRGAIQKYVYTQIAGNGLTSPSLQQMLLSVLLPTTPGSDLSIYEATIASAVDQSRQQVLGGIAQVYAGRLKISITPPNNPLGLLQNTGTGGTTATA